MAAVNDNISDQELRAKLKQHGISIGPITPSTKYLYIRKLNKKISEDGRSSVDSSVRSRKSISPKPTRRRVSVGRRSVDPTPSPGARLIGFSSDEDDSVKVPLATRQKRKSDGFKRSPKKALSQSSPPRHDNSTSYDSYQRRTQYVSTPNPKPLQNSENGVIGGYSNVEQKSENKRSFARLKNLFLKKTMDDSKRYSNTPVPQAQMEMPCDLEVEEEADENDYRYLWYMLIFFTLLTLAILFLWYWQAFGIMKKNEKLMLCGNLTNENDKATGCLSEVDVIKHLIEKLRVDLAYSLGLYRCGYSSSPAIMGKVKLTNWISKHSTAENINATVVLSKIMEFPQYGITCCDENGIANKSTDGVCENLISELALKPLMCRIKEAFSRVFFMLIFIFCVIVTAICIYFAVKCRWMRRERQTRRMFELVDKILEVLKNHHNECQQNKELSPYLAILHVRDMLIKPSEREALKSAWDDAVKFLSAKESRVRVETQRIAGEDFEVWRLLHHTTPVTPYSSSGSSAKQGKWWQGTAFENFSTAVNPPLISPTPCLKIRNMFEPVMETRESWHVFIEDAILEKCIEKGAAIVHISVDKTSNEGCVYVKCANHHSSGAAFRAIHGCWFDGRLVTVKFLTLKRYHQRFPSAIHAEEHLKPSGTSNSTIPRFESAPVNESDSDSDS